ncbi:MAG: HAMP domain-containing histidine kinase [Bacteroidales bacterium]|nr:HAMP domain-containing histidine kinase [Bacteroidales bacterium]
MRYRNINQQLRSSSRIISIVNYLKAFLNFKVQFFNYEIIILTSGITVLTITLNIHQTNSELLILFLWLSALCFILSRQIYLATLSWLKTNREQQLLSKTFLRNFSHQVRTPMNAIVGFSQLAAERTDNNETQAYLGHVMDCSRQLLTIIDNVVEVSKLESGTISIEKTRFNLKQFLTAYFDKVCLSTQNTNHFVLDIKEGHDVYLNTDKKALTSILNQLIDNANAYTKNGEITLGFTKSNRGAKLYVEDTGIGIPDNELRLVKHDFYRAGNGNDLYQKGTGIGLSICNKLAALIGGKLEIHSKLNAGTTVYLCLDN